jgi:hypothetical protein
MVTTCYDTFCDSTLSENKIEAPRVATNVDHPRHDQTEILRGKTLATTHSHDTGSRIK